MAPVLLMAALERELCEVEGARGVCCGIGPVEAALATAEALSANRFSAVLNVGTAGATALEPGTVVLGSASVYADVLDPNATTPRVAELRPDDDLLSLLRSALPEAAVLPIATTGRVGGGAGYEVEAMEGFGVLRAAAIAGVAAIEIRVVSNSPAQTDRRQWLGERAFASLHAAVRTAVPALTSAPGVGPQPSQASVAVS